MSMLFQSKVESAIIISIFFIFNTLLLPFEVFRFHRDRKLRAVLIILQPICRQCFLKRLSTCNCLILQSVLYRNCTYHMSTFRYCFIVFSHFINSAYLRSRFGFRPFLCSILVTDPLPCTTISSLCFLISAVLLIVTFNLLLMFRTVQPICKIRTAQITARSAFALS